MDVTVAAQVLTMVLAAVAIVWHQQRSIDKLRAEMRDEIGGLRDEIGGLRAEMRDEIGGLRAEMHAEFASLRAEVASNGQRLARIEGYLGIGMPPEAAAVAAGAALAESAPAQ
ncbi:hypothetical protein [Candidatus Poriferisodalis sp.]|uniref:hypothetical protein n=1 Tax=Candidatus Poriferisodalis sp. TaxID=3101277 RepID=UPI003B59A0C0